MAKTYFSQYIDDIDKIVEGAIHKHDVASIALEKASKSAEEAKRKYRVGEPERVIAEKSFEKAKPEYRKSIETIRSETEAAFASLRKDLAKHIADYTAADPSRVDTNAVMLLNSGSLRDTDLVSLANRFWSNCTMLKLIQAEAEKDLTNSMAARYVATAIAKHLSPTERLSVFDSATRAAMYTIQENGNVAGAHQKAWATEYFPSLRAAMAQTDSFKVEVE